MSANRAPYHVCNYIRRVGTETTSNPIDISNKAASCRVSYSAPFFSINSGLCTRNGASTGNDWCVLSIDSSKFFVNLWFCRLGSQLSRRQWAYAFALVTTLFFTCELRADSIEPRVLTSLTGGFSYGVSTTLCCTKPDFDDSIC